MNEKYEEIVLKLRNAGKESFLFGDLMRDAANVIEELSAFREQITNGHFYCMRNGILYEAKLNPPKAKSIKLPPIKFAEPPKEE